MLMLAFVFQNLAIRKPELDAGVFVYAKAGFGDYVGLQLGDRVLGDGMRRQHVLLGLHHGHDRARCSRRFGDGDTVLAVVVSTVGVWLFHYLIARGVKDAAVINWIVTVAKIIPILVFIVVAIFAFKADVFAANFWGRDGVLARRPQRAGQGHDAHHDLRVPRNRGRERLLPVRPKREDVGRATVLGFLSVLASSRW